MRALTAILTLVIFSYIQLYNAGVWVTYEINKSEIIQKFCENKDKPELKCEGTCHMKKMMITESSQEDGTVPVIVIPEIQLYFTASSEELGIQEIQSEYNSDYVNYYTFKFLDDWVIPPKG